MNQRMFRLIKSSSMKQLPENKCALVKPGWFGSSKLWRTRNFVCIWTYGSFCSSQPEQPRRRRGEWKERKWFQHGQRSCFHRLTEDQRRCWVETKEKWWWWWWWSQLSPVSTKSSLYSESPTWLTADTWTNNSELFTRVVWLGHRVQWRSGCAGCFSLSCLKSATWFKRWLHEAAAVGQKGPDCVHRARLLIGAQTYRQSASWCNLPSDLGQNICRVQCQTAGLRRWAGSGLLCSGLHGPEWSCLCTDAAVDQDHHVCVDRREQTYPGRLCSSRMYNPAGWLWDTDHTEASHSDLPGLWWAQWGKQLDTLLRRQTAHLHCFKAST